jgi:hypothetical protein
VLYQLNSHLGQYTSCSSDKARETSHTFWIPYLSLQSQFDTGRHLQEFPRHIPDGMDHRHATGAVIMPCGTAATSMPNPHPRQSSVRAQVLTPGALPGASLPTSHDRVQKGITPPSSFAGRRTNHIHHAMRDLKVKLFSCTDSATLRQVCCELADLPEEPSSCASGTADSAVFKRLPLALRVKTLRTRQYELLLPRVPKHAAAGIESVAAGDAEEQGSGGSCERFVGMLPASCRDISRRACSLGLVPRLLPYGAVSTNARFVGSCFWMWLCIVDGRWWCPFPFLRF